MTDHEKQPFELDGALADLIALVNRYGTPTARATELTVAKDRIPKEPDGGWEFNRLPPQHPKDAAVLILFGSLDDKPADYRVSRVPEELDILLTQRSLQLRKHPGQISFPGGGREEQDGSAIECALREAEEETGINPEAVTTIGHLPPVGIPVSGFNVTPVIGWWTRPSEIAVVDEDEATRVFRVPVADLVNPSNRIQVFTQRDTGIKNFYSPAFVVSDTLVWGFTAILIDRLLALLGWDEPWDHQRGFDVSGWNATMPVPKIQHWG